MKKIRNLLIIVLSFVLFSVPVFADVLDCDHTYNDYLIYTFKLGNYTYKSVTYFDRSNMSYGESSSFGTMLRFGPQHYGSGLSSSNIELNCVTSGSISVSDLVGKAVSVSSSMPDYFDALFKAYSSGIELPDIPVGDVDDGGDTEVVPPMSAPIVADWTEFTQMIAHNLKVIATTGCLVLSLVLSPILVKKLYLLVRP